MEEYGQVATFIQLNTPLIGVRHLKLWHGGERTLFN
jgi:hypothetical protein